MHSAAEELSTGPRLTTVMKPIPVRGEEEAAAAGGGGGEDVRGALGGDLKKRWNNGLGRKKKNEVNIDNKCV